MKKIIFITLLVTSFVYFFSSCEKIDGKATPPDFKSGPHDFTSEKKDFILTAKNNKNWWFDNITINGEDAFVLEKYNEIKYYRVDPNPNSDSKLGFVYKFENNWFVVEKIDSNHIKFSLKENNDKKHRSLTFNCSVGNSYTKIIINQKPSS